MLPLALKKMGEAGIAAIHMRDIVGHSDNFRGYMDGWIDYTIPVVADCTFIGGYIIYLPLST